MYVYCVEFQIIPVILTCLLLEMLNIQDFVPLLPETNALKQLSSVPKADWSATPVIAGLPLQN